MIQLVMFIFKSVRKVTNQVSFLGDHCVLIVSLWMTIGPVLGLDGPHPSTIVPRWTCQGVSCSDFELHFIIFNSFTESFNPNPKLL